MEFISSLERAGYEVGTSFVTALPRADYELSTPDLPNAFVPRRVEEGDVIDLGDRVFEILHLPGHSPGSMGLWESSSVRRCFQAMRSTMARCSMSCPAVIFSYLCAHDAASGEAAGSPLVHAGHDPSFDGARLRQLAQEYLDRRG